MTYSLLIMYAFFNLHPFHIDHMQVFEQQQRAEINFSNEHYVVYKLHHTVPEVPPQTRRRAKVCFDLSK